MARLAEVCLLVLALVLQGSAAGEDAYERALPEVLTRLQEVADVLLPVPSDVRQEMLFHLASYLVPLDAKREICRNHSNLLFDGILNHELWALRMFDASSKLPSGLIDGRFVDLGSPDQCVKVKSPGGEFRGKNCLVETKQLSGDFVENANPSANMSLLIRFGQAFTVCVPSSCDFEDVRHHMDTTLNSVNASSILTELNCYTDQSIEPYTPGQRAMIVLMAVLSGLIIASTVYSYRSAEKRPLLLVFSLPHNVQRLFSTKRTDVALGYVDGLRTIAITWVVLGHRILWLVAIPQQRYKLLFERFSDIEIAPLENSQLAVEMFFLLTGLLIAYSFLRSHNKGVKFHLGYYYLFRYLRMLPALVAVILLYATLAMRFADGPLWERMFGWQSKQCRTVWWTTILHINNYVKPYELCLGHTWYLASDFQLYLLSPVILLPLAKKPRLGLVLSGVCLVLTLGAGLWNAYSRNLRAGGAVISDGSSFDNFFHDYTQTQYRAASFIMGLVSGYFVYNIKQGLFTIKLSKLTVWAGWLTSVFLLLFTLFSVTYFHSPDYKYNKWIDSSYLVLHRPLFTLSIVWMIFACSLGCGGYVNKLLSWRNFMPVSRLSYGIFLLHELVQDMQLLSMKTSISPTLFQMWHGLFGDMVLSLMFSAILYLMVEAPFTKMIEILIKDNKGSKDDRKSDETLEVSTQVPNVKTTV